MSTKHLGLFVQRIREDEGADSLRAIATYVWASTHGTAKQMYFFKERKQNGNHWYMYHNFRMLKARTLKELIAIWRCIV